MFPLTLFHPLPSCSEPGSFGFERRFDVHTGIDLYCPDKTPVHALESGRVVAVEKFTGEHAQSPWWHNTWSVLVEGESGVVCYGEIEPCVTVGQSIEEKDILGRVIPVLKKDKGVTPQTMLHLELYSKGTKESLWWRLGEKRPINLLDPTPFLQKCQKKKKQGEKKMIKHTPEYQLIAAFYGQRKAKRSCVPLINHIHEGLFVLEHVGAPESALRAFCLHPLVQSDNDLEKNFQEVCSKSSPKALGLAMEYRNIANQYLSLRTITDLSDIALSPLTAVNQMLIADKVQNFKDFLLYHKETHPRSKELTEYFHNWLQRLGVSQIAFDWYFEELQK